MTYASKPNPGALLGHGIGLALILLSASCTSTQPQSGYLLGNDGHPVKNAQGVCVQIGPLTTADKKSECFQLAQSSLQEHIEPLPLDEFGYLFPPLKPKSQLAPVSVPSLTTMAAATPAQPIPVATSALPATPTLLSPTLGRVFVAPPLLLTANIVGYITTAIHFSTRTPFKLNRAYLSRKNRIALTVFVNSLERYRGVESIRITGHTDKSGPARFNKRLSVMRAESVQQWLLSLGVDPRTIKLRGVGSSEPRPHAHSAADDRYVDIEVVVRVPAG
ncbi:MAG: OmpA family protein [Gammaproteobacteria bacterium]